MIRVDCERVCQVRPENCVHIGERALALNSELRRPTIADSCLSSASAPRSPRVLVEVRHGRVHGGHHDARLSGGPRPGQATPLRSVPDGLTGLTAPAVRPTDQQVRDGLRRRPRCARKCGEIDFSARSDGIMIPSREKRNRRPRRARRHEATRDHRDEPLRLLVCVLARQAARERFEREVATARAIQPEVTLH